MRPKERRDSRQNDLFRVRLDQIVDLGHPLAKLGRAGLVGIDWAKPLLEKAPVDHDLSDEDLCARWVENPYYTCST